MQNEKTLQQMIKEHEAQMPSEILNLIKSFDWKKEVRTIVNQNQLMIDVGSDLEESIYLVLLGVVTAKQLYQRLVDAHELPEEKVQKIIEEAESQIFSPMYKKLMELPENDVPEKKPATPLNPRDAILAEIEKEPEVLVNLNVASINQNRMDAAASSIPSTPATPVTPVAQSTPPVQYDGIVKPFSINSFSAPVAKGVQEDPIASALTQKTQTQAPVQTPVPPQAPKSFTPDPYREPIE